MYYVLYYIEVINIFLRNVSRIYTQQNFLKKRSIVEINLSNSGIVYFVYVTILANCQVFVIKDSISLESNVF